jgi:hypothetical protein
MSAFSSFLNVMHRVVFYSWQSDLPNATNRSFIQQALENVAKTIRSDDTVDVEPVIDRDTQGVPGAPDIAKTIFQKVTTADVVVADVSIIGGSRKGRATPNPNVLIELGFALHALGDERVVLVFNTAYGKVEQLPFDLKMRRAVSYAMSESHTDRATERRALEVKLELAIRTALATVKKKMPPSSLAEAIEKIETVTKNRVISVRRLITELIGRLEAKRPKSITEGASAKDLEEAVLSTEDVSIDYARLAQTVAVMGDEESALALYRGFGPLVERYNAPRDFRGTIYDADFDFMKFHGHEMFTIFIACLMREERWELIKKLLSEGIPLRYQRAEHGPGISYFEDISQHLHFGLVLGKERRRTSVHADILEARHNSERPLGQTSPFDEFMSADYFLFLRGELPPETAPQSFFAWRPWSALYLSSAPRFIRDAQSVAVAKRIAAALDIPDILTFRRRLLERASRLERLFTGGFWAQPLRPEDIERIGTRGEK